MPSSPNHPPQSICLLRLSALGDVSHMIPVVRTLQAELANCKITWIIGKLEAELVKNINNIELIIFDKSLGSKAYIDLYKTLQGRKFDVLLHMQVALRASIASLAIRAKRRIGFDRARARDLQWLFSNESIAPVTGQHVIDGFFEFLKVIGIQQRHLEWNLPIDSAATEYADKILDGKRTLIINPSASAEARNWSVEGYAAIADYAIEKYKLQVILTGGPAANERELGERVEQVAKHPMKNIIGQTSIQQMLAVLKQALLLVAPDTGPAHMATAVDTPVIGLYATMNPRRTGPYLSQENIISVYEQALLDEYRKTVDQLAWGTRVHSTTAMSQISVAAVKTKLDTVLSK